MNPTGNPSSRPFVPFVPEASTLPELTFRAVLLGTAMAIVLGTANAYLGMRAGLTVAATFPAAVVAMAALRILGGSVLEENMARTTASVGEALVAGAIFTIPAFVITGVWDELQYWESTAIMLVGGVLGVLFIIVLRRTLVVEAELPFPESVAAAELVKAGQGGRQTGAAYVFKAMGLAAGWELLKNTNGLKLVSDSATTFVSLGRSTIEMLGQQVSYVGGFLLQSPGASPALVGVGFIVGPQIAATLFAGAVLGWLLLVPLGLFLNPALAAQATGDGGFVELSMEVWQNQVRPLAVGTMIVAAFYTLYRLRTSLFQGIGRALGDLQTSQEGSAGRQDIDIAFRKVGLAIGALAVPLFGLYWYFSGSFGGAILLTVLMVILGFLFAAVAGYLGGRPRQLQQPDQRADAQHAADRGHRHGRHRRDRVERHPRRAGGGGGRLLRLRLAGDMLQDLKVGHILGGTPWKMQIGELIGVTVAAMVLIYPMILMDRVYEIGSPELPAPQAGLMALMSEGIVGGQMAWPLVIAGMALAGVLILISAPSPMLIAVGMYLPLASTAGIFVGGLVRWWLTRSLDQQQATGEQRTRAGNTGVLLSSGFIAGEALMAVLLAFVVGASEALPWLALPQIADSALAGALIFIVLYYALVKVPLKAMGGGQSGSGAN